jgi:hypothetical protein
MRCVWLLITTCIGSQLYAQRQQMWLDYQVDYPFANQYLFEVTASYQTVLSNEDKWRSMSLTTLLEVQVFSWFDAIGGVPIAHTVQTDDYNTFESSPYLGGKFYFTQNKRIDTKATIKFEERFLKNLEEGDWQSSSRARLKAEAWIAINKPNHYQDKLWYTFLDYEEFFVMDEQVDERFANLRRGRVGLGYRLSYRHRFEFVYTLQSSRNEIQGEFKSTDNVLQLRYKMFLNAAKPQKATD